MKKVLETTLCYIYRKKKSKKNLDFGKGLQLNSDFSEFEIPDLSTVAVENVTNKEILLGYKKRGFGKDLYNGFGGKIEGNLNETVLESCKREVKEECGISIACERMVKCGEITFTYADHPLLEIFMHVFTYRLNQNEASDDVDDVIVESEEMKPIWVSFDRIPYDQMWTSDTLWLPQVISDLQKNDVDDNNTTTTTNNNSNNNNNNTKIILAHIELDTTTKNGGKVIHSTINYK